jgi:aquaporin related protein
MTAQQPLSPTIGTHHSTASPTDGLHSDHDLEKQHSRGRFHLKSGRFASTSRGPSGLRRQRFRDLSKSEQAKLRMKNHMLAMVGEYVGTTLFCFFAFGGTQVALVPNTSITGATATANGDGSASAAEVIQAPNTSSLQFVALSFGFSLTVTAWTFYRVSGGLFNPAVSLGLALVGVITPVRAILLTIVQCLGAITGAALIQVIIPGPLYVTTRLASNMSPARGVFMEMFLTIMLMLTILLLAAEKSKATFLAPIGIGLALFITQLVGVYYTGASVNPARSLGPDVVIRSFPSYHWIYWVGPAVGTIIACAFYKMIKLLHYETVVPGQDSDMVAGLGGGDKADKKNLAVDESSSRTEAHQRDHDTQRRAIIPPAENLAHVGPDERRSSIINIPGAGSVALDGLAGPGFPDYYVPAGKGSLRADGSSNIMH